jgi:ribonucleotide monophosphatase NagD (HAD superfamily)
MLNNFKIPGGGCMVHAVRKATGVEPITTGKPNPLALDLILAGNNIPKERCIMIGDNLDTDIGFANNAGIDSLAVMTGVMKEPEFLQEMKQNSKPVPTYYAEDLEI